MTDLKAALDASMEAVACCSSCDLKARAAIIAFGRAVADGTECERAVMARTFMAVGRRRYAEDMMSKAGPCGCPKHRTLAALDALEEGS